MTPLVTNKRSSQMTDESGTFQSGDGEAYRDGTPSPKRSRYDSSGDIDSSEEGSVHLSMPQTQFEIEINSHHDTGSPTQDIEAHDLAGPTFAVIEEQVSATAVWRLQAHCTVPCINHSFVYYFPCTSP